ncbi:cation diffusion facilitator family transporter (plasmid) [Haloferax sp. S1W]|uniref:cation diffusion facilitator family transporter n=1 Tax=Haloferax sp. S1W TaxID=3377110 RepID=UPI0037CBE5C7
MESHDHSEQQLAGANVGSRKLAVVAGINLVGFLLELAGGLLFGSVALLSDAMHMLFDMLAYAMAFSASYTVERFEGGAEWSFGLHRLEPIAAFLNGVLLLPMVGYIVYESLRRFNSPVEIDPILTLVIAVGGLGINLGSVAVLRGDEMSLNERGAFYHLLGDAGGSIAVIVSTIAVAVFDLPVVDPIAAIFIAVLVFWSAARVLRESTSILLERSPIPPDNVRQTVLDIESVSAVEDLHVWQVCSQLTVATLTVRDSSRSLEDRQRTRAAIHTRLAELGINHVTVELVDEPRDGRDSRAHTH